MPNQYVNDGRGPDSGGTVLAPVRVTRAEKLRVEADAAAAGMKTAAYIRACLGLTEAELQRARDVGARGAAVRAKKR